MSGDQYVFEKWFLLDIPASYLVWTILAYLLTSILFYLITVLWTQSLYGKYLKSLDQIIKDLD